MPIKSNREDFIKKSNIIHNNLYDYSLVEYVNNKTKVKIICKYHGVFEQRPDNHINGQHCPICGNSIKDNKLRWNTDKFIKKSNLIHNYLYDYSLVEYTSSKEKVSIICNKHGKFKQSPTQHILGQGCNSCAIILNTDKSRSNTSEIVSRFNLVHNNKYDYSLVNYIDAKTKVVIICKKHGQFEQIPHNHLVGQHCPKCSISKGVEKICKILDNNKIEYKIEQTIPGCISEKNMLLRFDVYIPILNTYIEYDGEQHFRPVEIWGGKETFLSTKKRDKIKNDFCKKKKINLYRISYKENIDDKIEQLLNLA